MDDLGQGIDGGLAALCQRAGLGLRRVRNVSSQRTCWMAGGRQPHDQRMTSSVGRSDWLGNCFPLEQVEQQVHRLVPGGVEWLAHGGQRHAQRLRFGDIIETDQGNLGGHLAPALLQRIQDAEGHAVIGGDHCLEVCMALVQQQGNGGAAAFGAEVARRDQRFIQRDGVGLAGLKDRPGSAARPRIVPAVRGQRQCGANHAPRSGAAPPGACR